VDREPSTLASDGDEMHEEEGDAFFEKPSNRKWFEGGLLGGGHAGAELVVALSALPSSVEEKFQVRRFEVSPARSTAEPSSMRHWSKNRSSPVEDIVVILDLIGKRLSPTCCRWRLQRGRSSGCK